MRFDKHRSAGFLTNHLARLFGLALHERIAPLGLAPAQFMALLELWEGDGLTQADLMERLDVEQATLANTLNRMERDGLIRRTAHPEDRRARLIWLTDRARHLEAEAKRAAASVNAEALTALDANDRDRLLDLMSRVIGRMRERRAARRP